MHPAPAFAWEDEGEMIAFVSRTGFATICVDGPAVVHTPVIAEGRRLRFHVARANRATPKLGGARAIASVVGAHAYVSPDWYGTPDQVPTWNYLAVEAEGPLTPLDDASLAALLDDLSAVHEAELAPKPAWTRDKMDDRRFRTLLKGIVGFEMTIDALRGTRKLGQNKTAGEADGVIDALDRLGEAAMTQAMRAARSSLMPDQRGPA